MADALNPSAVEGPSGPSTTPESKPTGVISRPGLLERMFVVAVLLLTSGALVPMLRLPDPEGSPWAASTGNGLQQAIWLGVYLTALITVLPRWRTLLAAMAVNKWIPALMALALASTFWSTTPALTFRRAAAVDLAGLFGYYLAIHFTRRQVLELLAIALGTALLLSFIFVVFLPSYGVYFDQYRGLTWRGVFLHKQPLGRAASLGVLVFLLQEGGGRRRWIRFGGAALGLLLVIESGSSTAIIATVAMGAVALMLLTLDRKRPLALPTLLTATCALLLTVAAAHLNPVQGVLGILGKEGTLTGRTGLWSHVIAAIGHRPYLGYGWSNFWRGWGGPGSATVWHQVDWHPVHSHSGYLDLLLDVGVVGFAVFLMGALKLVRQAIVRYRAVGHRRMDLWPLLFLTFWLMEATTENVLVQNSIFWVLFVFTAASVGMAERRGGAEIVPQARADVT